MGQIELYNHFQKIIIISIIIIIISSCSCSRSYLKPYSSVQIVRISDK